MNNTIEVTFKKLLGKGRAFLTPRGFTSDFLDCFIAPFTVLKNKIISLKFTHFPSLFVNEINIKNGEELFDIKDTGDKTFVDRASLVEAQWGLLNGSLNWKPLEEALKKLSIKVSISENIPPKAINTGSLSLYGGFQYSETLSDTDDYVRYGMNANRQIGNGIIEVEGKKYDPCEVENKGVSQYGSYCYGGYDSDIESYIQYGIKGGSANCFFITSDEPITSKQYEALVKIVLQKKPAHTVAICNLKVID